MKEPQKSIMWACYSSDGRCDFDTMRWTRRDSKRVCLKQFSGLASSWDELKLWGWRCVKVQITPLV